MNRYAAAQSGNTGWAGADRGTPITSSRVGNGLRSGQRSIFTEAEPGGSNAMMAAMGGGGGNGGRGGGGGGGGGFFDSKMQSFQFSAGSAAAPGRNGVYSASGAGSGSVGSRASLCQWSAGGNRNGTGGGGCGGSQRTVTFKKGNVQNSRGGNTIGSPGRAAVGAGSVAKGSVSKGGLNRTDLAKGNRGASVNARVFTDNSVASRSRVVPGTRGSAGEAADRKIRVMNMQDVSRFIRTQPGGASFSDNPDFGGDSFAAGGGSGGGGGGGDRLFGPSSVQSGQPLTYASMEMARQGMMPPEVSQLAVPFQPRRKNVYLEPEKRGGNVPGRNSGGSGSGTGRRTRFSSAADGVFAESARSVQRKSLKSASGSDRGGKMRNQKSRAMSLSAVEGMQDTLTTAKAEAERAQSTEQAADDFIRQFGIPFKKSTKSNASATDEVRKMRALMRAEKNRLLSPNFPAPAGSYSSTSPGGANAGYSNDVANTAAVPLVENDNAGVDSDGEKKATLRNIGSVGSFQEPHGEHRHDWIGKNNEQSVGDESDGNRNGSVRSDTGNAHGNARGNAHGNARGNAHGNAHGNARGNACGNARGNALRHNVTVADKKCNLSQEAVETEADEAASESIVKIQSQLLAGANKGKSQVQLTVLLEDSGSDDGGSESGSFDEVSFSSTSTAATGGAQKLEMSKTQQRQDASQCPPVYRLPARMRQNIAASSLHPASLAELFPSNRNNIVEPRGRADDNFVTAGEKFGRTPATTFTNTPNSYGGASSPTGSHGGTSPGATGDAETQAKVKTETPAGPGEEPPQFFSAMIPERQGASRGIAGVSIDNYKSANASGKFFTVPVSTMRAAGAGGSTAERPDGNISGALELAGEHRAAVNRTVDVLYKNDASNEQIPTELGTELADAFIHAGGASEYVSALRDE